MRFRPSKRALGKLNEGHPDAHDSPAVPQLRCHIPFSIPHTLPAIASASHIPVAHASPPYPWLSYSSTENVSVLVHMFGHGQLVLRLLTCQAESSV